MVFLDENNIIVLEKEGNVRLVVNGILQEPILQIPVDAEGERGLLGVAISNASNGSNGSSNGSSQSGQTTTNVFLYYTEDDPLRNRIYKYQGNGETLTIPNLFLIFWLYHVQQIIMEVK
jgi:aldose sugar dehydrogenase